MTPVAWRASHDEAESVARLLVAFRDHLGRDAPSANAFLAGVERLLDDPQTEFLLAATGDGDAPAGVCQLRYRFGVWYAATDCWLEDLFVEQAARGAGLGSALIDLAVERAQARGCRRIELDTDPDGDARRLYERHGFAVGSAVLGRRL